MEFCKVCGSIMNNEDVWCKACGAKKQPDQRYGNPPMQYAPPKGPAMNGSDYQNQWSNGPKPVNPGNSNPNRMNRMNGMNGANGMNGMNGMNSSTDRNNSTPAQTDDSKNSTELWTWLKKKADRKHFFTETPNTTSQNEFCQRVQQKIWENGVPARIDSRVIQWDISTVTDTIWEVKPQVSVENPLTCILKFEHVGKFSFVEKKEFITPPKLPDVPEKRKEVNPIWQRLTALLWVGIVLFIAGFMYGSEGVGFYLLGIMALLIGFGGVLAINEVKTHNEKVTLQEIEWEKAWSNWEDSIFVHAFQEEIDGQVGRIYEAVYECVGQVCNELFPRVQPEKHKEEADMNQLEEMILRRKNEYR